jgi:hypothetical protein
MFAHALPRDRVLRAGEVRARLTLIGERRTDRQDDEGALRAPRINRIAGEPFLSSHPETLLRSCRHASPKRGSPSAPVPPWDADHGQGVGEKTGSPHRVPGAIWGATVGIPRAGCTAAALIRGRRRRCARGPMTRRRSLERPPRSARAPRATITAWLMDHITIGVERQ